MRLQIKKLEGPDEIKIDNNATLPGYNADFNDGRAGNKFTCYFNRATRAEDFEGAEIRVKIKIYDNEGSEHAEQTLTVLSGNVTDADGSYRDHFYFTITLDSPETFSGSFFHIHAIRENDTISYRVGSYHTTIKRIYISSDKEFLEVYWSRNEQPPEDPQEVIPEDRPEDIPAEGENETWERERPVRESGRQTTRQTTRQTQRTERERTGEIHQNEDAFLYIKAKGMYSDRIAVVLTANEGNQILLRRSVQLKQNNRVVAFNVLQVIQEYRRLNDLSAEEAVSFDLKAWVVGQPSDGQVVDNAAMLPSHVAEDARILFPIVPPSLAVPSRVPITIGTASNRRVTLVANLVFNHSGVLETLCTDVDPPAQATSTGTVYVRVSSAETPEVTPTKFTDFRIGFMSHIEGVGKLANLNNNNNHDASQRSIYQIKAYTIMLSDLVACGLVTVDEAAYLTTTNHDCRNLRTRADLENTFNKVTAPLSSTKTLMSIFQDRTNANIALRNRINKTSAQKVLAQVRVKATSFNNWICRDAWQNDTGRLRAGKYNYAKECPPGEYFIHFRRQTGSSPHPRTGRQVPSPKYRMKVSQTLNEDTIYTYHNKGVNDPNRSVIALHNGGPTNSTGCLTFNTTFNYGVNAGFNDVIYDSADMTDANANLRFLNLLCMDERNALQLPVQQPRDVNTNYYRYYDLVDPNNRIT